MATSGLMATIYSVMLIFPVFTGLQHVFENTIFLTFYVTKIGNRTKNSVTCLSLFWKTVFFSVKKGNKTALCMKKQICGRLGTGAYTFQNQTLLGKGARQTQRKIDSIYWQQNISKSPKVSCPFEIKCICTL